MSAVPTTPGASWAKTALVVRLDRLNTLRALSILGVFAFHVLTALFARSAASIDRFVAHSGDWAKTFENLGLLLLSQAPRLVSIFFLMSGYFIHRTFLLWVRRNPTYLAFARFFLWRRFWRLVPPFWFALVLSYAISYQHPLEWDSLRKLLVNATLMKTLVPGYFFSVNYAHWYVAVQWQLDLLYPIFLYIIWRFSFRIALGATAALGFLTIYVFPHVSVEPYIYNLPFRWGLEAALGTWVAVAHSQKRRAFPRPRQAALLLVIALVGAGCFDIGPVIWACTALGLALILELFLLSHRPLLAIERWLAPVGLWSYSFYLLHVPIIGICQRFLERHGFDENTIGKTVLLAALSLAFSLGVAALCYRLIEEKSSALGKRCWSIIQKIRRSPRAPAFLVRPHVRQQRESETLKSTV